MANHVLSLDIPDTLNGCLLRVIDTSVYTSSLAITCPTLNITPPGYSHSIELTDITAGFSLNLTACDLEIQTQNCGTDFIDLPDGIYIIKYSVSPNSIVYVEYNHLRITQVLKKWKKVLCSLQLAACDPPSDKKKKLLQLRLIKDYLDAAKAEVEFCHHPKKGMELFSYACKLLSKFNCASC